MADIIDKLVVVIGASTEGLDAGLQQGSSGLEALKEQATEAAVAVGTAAESMVESLGEVGAAADAVASSGISALGDTVAATGAQVADASATMSTALEDTAAAADAQATDLATLESVMAGLVTTSDAAAAAEDALDRLMAEGAISAEAQQAAIDALSASLAKATAARLADAEAARLQREATASAISDATLVSQLLNKEITTTAQLTSAKEALARVRGTGAFTVEEEQAAEKAIITTQTSIQKALKDTEEATKKLSQGWMNNSRTMYSFSAALEDIATGQFSRTKREIGALATETGLMQKALSALMGPMGFVAAGIGIVGLSALEASRDFSDMEGVVARTNNYWGESAGELEAVADQIADVTKESKESSQAVQDLAGSGRFAGDALRDAGEAAVEFADATGIKIEEVDKLLVEMATHPQKALDALENTYHIIDPAQRNYIAQLIRGGDVAGASKAELDAFTKAAHADFAQMSDDASGFGAELDLMGHTIHNLFHGLGQDIQMAFGGGDAAEKLESLQRTLKVMKESDPNNKAGIDGLEQQIAALQKVVNLKHQDAAATREVQQMEEQAAPAQGTFGALQQRGVGGVDIAGNLEGQLHELEAAQQVSYEDREQFERSYWSNILQQVKTSVEKQQDEIKSAGKNATDSQQQELQRTQEIYTTAYQHVQEANKQLSDELTRTEEETERKREETLRKGAAAAKRAKEEEKREAMNALREERNDADANSKAIIEIDQKMVDTARKLYGEKSNAFVEADRQMREDQKRLAKQAEQEARETNQVLASEAVDDANFEIQVERDKLQQKQAMGEITRTQEVQGEQQLEDKLYNMQLDAFAKELQLDSLTVPEKMKIYAEIEKAAQKHYQTMEHLADQAQQYTAQRYQQMMRPVTSAIQQSVQGMVQGTETGRQALARIGQSILGEFISQETEKLTIYISNELAKTATTETQTAVRLATEEAGHAQSLAMQAEGAIKWIVTEAAKAAAGAFNAMVSIPYVGPFLAVGASIAAGAAVLALLSRVASAEGGWERVPADGMMTELHKDEMVLPARIANPMRQLATSGAIAGGGGEVHIHATDGASFKNMLRRNPRAIQDAMRRAKRSGYMR